MKKLFTQYPVAAWAITIGVIALVAYAIRQAMKNGNGNTARTRLGWQKAYTRVAPVTTPISSVIVTPAGAVGARVGGGGVGGVAK